MKNLLNIANAIVYDIIYNSRNLKNLLNANGVLDSDRSTTVEI